MNIAFVTNEFISESSSFDGGLSNYIYNIARFLKKDNHKVVIFVKASKDEIIDFEGMTVVRVAFHKNKLFKLLDVATRFKREKLLKDLFQSYYFSKAIQSYHSDEKIDIVHYSNLHLYFSIRPKNIPFVVRMSSYLPTLSKESDTTYLDGLGLRKYLEKRLVIKHYKRMFLPSFKLQSDIYQETNKKLAVIESPFVKLDKSEWNLQARELVSFNKYFMFFGRFIELKGVVEISKAINTLFSEGLKFNFVFLGKDKDFEGKMMSENLLNNIDARFHKHIQILPSQEKRSLYTLIEGAELIILPSRTENLSNAGIESLALGTPLIGTKGASFEQIIDDQKNGFLCEINNVQSIVNAVKNFLALTDDERGRMGEEAKESMKRMSGNNISNHLVKFYKKNI